MQRTIGGLEKLPEYLEAIQPDDRDVDLSGPLQAWRDA